MSEQDTILNSQKPITKESLRNDLLNLGLKENDLSYKKELTVGCSSEDLLPRKSF